MSTDQPCPDCQRVKCVCDPFAYENARDYRQWGDTYENRLTVSERERAETEVR